MRFLITALITLSFPCYAQAELTMPPILGDHMVLQQGSTAVWGQAKPGAKIEVSIAGRKAQATAGTDGRWKAVLAGLQAGGPHEMTVSGDGTLTVTDVLIGDVWMGSGQSNMEFPMNRTHDSAEMIAQADRPQMRLFTVKQATASSPAGSVQGEWKVCSPTTVAPFSAVAYHFGRQVHEALKTPVGLVVAAWGGTAAESWTPKEAFEADPRLEKTLEYLNRDEEQVKAWGDGLPYELRIADVRLVAKDRVVPVNLKSGGKGIGGAWAPYITAPSTGTFKIEGKGPQGGPVGVLSGLMRGQGWITLMTNFQSGDFDLTPFESIDYSIRGRCKYRMKIGQASIADYNYYSTDILSAPETWESRSVPIAQLKQGDWGTKRSFTPEAVQSLIFNPEVPYAPNAAYVIYNAMIAPLANLRIRGAIWYQGESNADRASDYQALLSALIRGWRKAWGEEFPFYIVQLPNFMQVQPEPSESSWAELREAQMKTALAVPDTGIATVIDLGVADDIHPRNKTEVGRRLALSALAGTYGKSMVHSGPRFKGLQVKGSKMVLTFTEIGRGLATLDGKPVTGFAISGESGDFRWAAAKIKGKDTLEVWNDTVKKPLEVRYAWADNPVCNLSNHEGLPASPFRYHPDPAAYTKTADENSVESWRALTQAGVYQDTVGSSISHSVEEGPEARQKALKLTFDLKAGGFCGLWHNLSVDLSKAQALVFQAKTTLPGQMQISLKDKWNVQYITLVTVPSGDWTEVRAPFSSFKKDPYYTPPEAQLGHPMDLSTVNGMNFGPQAVGKGELWIGPVSAE